MRIVLRELTTSTDDRGRLLSFYANVYEREFPDPDERESLENIQRYLELKAKGWYGSNNYHVVVAYDGASPVGGCILDYLDEPNAAVIEFLFAAASVRGEGLGQRLMAETQRLAEQDAERRGRRLRWLAAEMNDPFIAPPVPDNMDPFLRARIWDDWGFGALDCPYVQPALSEDQQPAEGLVLIAKCLDPAWRSEVPARDVATLVAAYLRWAMRIDAPSKDPQYRALHEWLQRNPGVRRVPLRRYIGEFESGTRDPAAFQAVEVRRADQPEFGPAIDIYRRAFASPSTAIKTSLFEECLHRPHGAYRYHMWALRSGATGDVAGMASFFGLKRMGFGGYIVLDGALRGVGALRTLVARMEQQLIVDALDIAGWLIECESDRTAEVFRRQGFSSLAVPYRQPALHDGAGTASTAMSLMYKPLGRVYGVPQLTREQLLSGLHEVLHRVYSIDQPASHPTFQAVAAALRDLELVPMA